MKNLLIVIISLFLFESLMSQIQVNNGPEIKNKRGNSLNKMFVGEDNSFYCYSVRSKGKGTSFYLDKYDQTTLGILFSKELDFNYSTLNKIIDVKYSQGRIYIFSKEYSNESKKMVLYFQTVSSKGIAEENRKVALSIDAGRPNHVDFDISQNPSQTNFLIKASYKKVVDSVYQTDFMMFEAKDMNLLWSKTIDRKLFKEDLMINSASTVFGAFSRFVGIVDDDFIGMDIDDSGRVFYVVQNKKKDSTRNLMKNKLGVGFLSEKSDLLEWLDLGFANDYIIENVKFSKPIDNQLVVAGAFREKLDKESSQPQKCGLFSFKIDLLNKVVISNVTKVLDSSNVQGIEDDIEQLKFYKFNLDYIFPNGKDIFYVGELYKEEHRVAGYMINGNINKRPYFQFEYMNVVVIKFNEIGGFEWVMSNPLRSEMRMNKWHIFKQYFAVQGENNIYIINNEHENNLKKIEDGKFSYNDLKSFSEVEGSNFVTTSYSMGGPEMKHYLNFKNEFFLFDPIQERNFVFEASEDSEMIVVGSKGEIILYTNDEEKDRFTKLIIP